MQLISSFRWLTTLCALFFAGASIFRSQGWFIHDIYYAQEFLGGDKATHFWAGLIFMLCISAWLSSWRSWPRFLLATLVVFSVLILEEFSQQFTSRRSFSWFDMAATLGGASLAMIGALMLLLIRKTPDNSAYASKDNTV